MAGVGCTLQRHLHQPALATNAAGQCAIAYRTVRVWCSSRSPRDSRVDDLPHRREQPDQTTIRAWALMKRTSASSFLVASTPGASSTTASAREQDGGETSDRPSVPKRPTVRARAQSGRSRTAHSTTRPASQITAIGSELLPDRGRARGTTRPARRPGTATAGSPATRSGTTVAPTISARIAQRRPAFERAGAAGRAVGPGVADDARQVHVEQREDQRHPAEDRDGDGERKGGELADGAAGR